MDISNIYLKNESFEIFAFKAELNLVDLEINKGTNVGYQMALHGSVVELHVGGADLGTGTTGLINGTKAMQLEIAETSVRAVHKFPK